MISVFGIVGGCIAAAVLGTIVYMAYKEEKDIDDELTLNY